MQTEKITTHIVDWLNDYLQQSRQKGFILGISGGIDSAVVSTLCAQTGAPLLCLDMPIHQEAAQLNRAKDHIEWLKKNFQNVKSTTVDLTTVYDEFVKQLKTSDNEVLVKLSLANSRARLRMTTLYYYAGIHSLLVAGTGNKIEDFGIGFFTKYGDGGVDISPIGDLMKSEVYAIAKSMGILESILVAAPTDGLFGDNRTDEMQIGATYDELEFAMKAYDSGKTKADFTGRAAEVFELYQNRHLANLHKMKPVPVCVIPEYLKK